MYCIIYLHVIEACVKVAVALFYFCHLHSSSNIMENIFDSKILCQQIQESNVL